MKKITLLTAALTSAAALAGSGITANAANTKNFSINTAGCRVIISGQSLNDLNDLLNQLQNCFPGIVIPDIQKPGQNCPSVPELPSPEKPSPEAPSPEQPSPENPSPEQPSPENPSPEQPSPETPAPEQPSPEQPSPENPAPEQPSPEQPSPENPTPEQPDSTASAYIARVVELVNRERAREGLAPLTVNQSVQAAAQVRAQEIVTSFSHTRPNGSSFSTALKEQNVSYRSAGENIAWGQRSPEEVVNAWMNSAGHRANIMNAGFTAIGVGYFQHNGINYWCQLFTS